MAVVCKLQPPDPVVSGTARAGKPKLRFGNSVPVPKHAFHPPASPYNLGDSDNTKLFTLEYNGKAFAVKRSDRNSYLHLVGFRNEEDACAVAYAIEHHVDSLEVWPNNLLKDGCLELYIETMSSSRRKPLKVITVREWERKRLVVFATIHLLHLGVVSYSHVLHDKNCILFGLDSYHLRTKPEVYASVFEALYNKS